MWLLKFALFVSSLIVLSIAAAISIHFLIKLSDHFGWFGWQRRERKPDSLQTPKKKPKRAGAGKSDAA
jgi:hypothetical protein